MTPEEAEDRYDQIGVLCYVRSDRTSTTGCPTGGGWPCRATDPQAETATLVHDVRGHVCALGGEIVVRHGFCNVAGATGIEVGVYVRRSGPLSYWMIGVPAGRGEGES